MCQVVLTLLCVSPSLELFECHFILLLLPSSLAPTIELTVTCCCRAAMSIPSDCDTWGHWILSIFAQVACTTTNRRTFGWKYQGSPGFTTGAVDGDTIADGGRAPTGVGGSGTRGVPRAEGVRGIIAEEEEPVMHSQIMIVAAS